MKPITLCLGLAVLAVVAFAQAGPAGDPQAGTPGGPDEQGLSVIVGELRAAAPHFEGGATGVNPAEALAQGQPGGVLADGRFTLLLVDGRVLAQLRKEQPPRENQVRARGIAHDDGRSLTPVRIEYKSDGEWLPFDLPRSGTLARSVEGGDE